MQRPVSASDQTPPSWQLTAAVMTAHPGPGGERLRRACRPAARCSWNSAGDGGERRPEWLAAARCRQSRRSPLPTARTPTQRARPSPSPGRDSSAWDLPEMRSASFRAPFREGMFQEDRLRRLGDRRDGQWLGTVDPRRARLERQHAAARRRQAAETARRRADLDRTQGGAGRHADHRARAAAALRRGPRGGRAGATRSRTALAPHRRRRGRRLPLELLPDAKGISARAFRLRRRPVAAHSLRRSDAVELTGGAATRHAGIHGTACRSGEILIGHINGHHEKAPGPVVPDNDGGRASGLAAACAGRGLPRSRARRQLMVVRELRQDVAASGSRWTRSRSTSARAIRSNRAHVTATGWPSGWSGATSTAICSAPAGCLPANAYGLPDRTISVSTTATRAAWAARWAAMCAAPIRATRWRPTGRRQQTCSTPRTTTASCAAAANLGRRSSDPPYGRRRDRGLLFMCLNTDIARQFEFVQQTWLLNTNFATLYDETDPLVGPKGTMTIHEQPLRRIGRRRRLSSRWRAATISSCRACRRYRYLASL